MNLENYYRTLGVSENATDVEIKKAYVIKIRQFPNETHPEEFQLLTKAYKTLYDPEQRNHYDAWLEERRAVTRISTEGPVNTGHRTQTHTEQESPSRPTVVHQDQPKEQPDVVPPTNQNAKKKRPILSILLACAALFILYTIFAPSEDNIESSQPVVEEVDSSVEKMEPEDTTEVTDVPVEEPEPVETAIVEISPDLERNVEDFLYQYFQASVDVINGQDFVAVERFLDPIGKKLEEQRTYTNYLLEKGTTEEFVSMVVQDLHVNDEFIVATTEEVYVINYADGSAKRKGFESQYHLRQVGEQLLVNELLYTNELSSEDIRGPEPTVDVYSVEQFMHQYLADSVYAINYQDFTYAEPYLAPNSTRFSEQLEYTNYLIDKGITEELLEYELVSVEEIGDATYEVTTREAYTIYYSDGSSSYKRFESRFHIIETGSGFEVSQLIYTNEIQ